jgi:hypothetical protein
MSTSASCGAENCPPFSTSSRDSACRASAPSRLLSAARSRARPLQPLRLVDLQPAVLTPPFSESAPRSPNLGRSCPPSRPTDPAPRLHAKKPMLYSVDFPFRAISTSPLKTSKIAGLASHTWNRIRHADQEGSVAQDPHPLADALLVAILIAL